MKKNPISCSENLPNRNCEAQDDVLLKMIFLKFHKVVCDIFKRCDRHFEKYIKVLQNSVHQNCLNRMLD